MSHDKRPTGWNHTNRGATSSGSCITLHHIGNKTKHTLTSWPYWSQLLKHGGARLYGKGGSSERCWAVQVHTKMNCTQLHSGTAANKQAWFDGGRMQEMPYRSQHRTLIFLDICLLQSARRLYPPWHQEEKKEVNANLMTFFHKNGDLCGTLCKQPTSVQSAGTTGHTDLPKSASELPPATNPSPERGTATAVSHRCPESLPGVLNTSYRQLGSSLKLQQACQPVFAERLRLNASSKESEKN